MIIEVKDVKRSFRSVKKEEGLRGALGLMLKPQYSAHEALKGVSFTIEEGTFNGLIGANGAGKTTLLKILSGLIPTSSGTARVLGEDPFKRSLNFRHKISLVMGQKAQLWWDLPAIDAFDLLQAIYEIPKAKYQERLHHLAELLDVKRMLSTQIRRLSLGERMKMELIGAILHWPSVIFLDEPTIGLDVLAAHNLREFLRVFNAKEKSTIILTSHNMDDIERLCSRVLILRDGSLIYDGTPAGLTEKGERRFRVKFFGTPEKTELVQKTGIPSSGIEIEQEEAGQGSTARFGVQTEKIVPLLQKLITNYKIVDMGIEEQSLETVIHRLYESDRESDREIDKGIA